MWPTVTGHSIDRALKALASLRAKETKKPHHWRDNVVQRDLGVFDAVWRRHWRRLPRTSDVANHRQIAKGPGIMPRPVTDRAHTPIHIHRSGTNPQSSVHYAIE